MNKACIDPGQPETGLAAEVARLSENLAQSEMQIAALNQVLEMMRNAAGGRFTQRDGAEPQALSA